MFVNFWLYLGVLGDVAIVIFVGGCGSAKKFSASRFVSELSTCTVDKMTQMPNGLLLVIIGACSCQTAMPLDIFRNYYLLHLDPDNCEWKVNPMQMIVGWNVGRLWSVTTVTESDANHCMIFRQCLRQLFKQWPIAQDQLQRTYSHSWKYLNMGQTEVHCWVKGNQKKQSKTCRTNLSHHISVSSEVRALLCQVLLQLPFGAVPPWCWVALEKSPVAK